MDRGYTTVPYEHADIGRKVFINDVQEPNSFGGWGYLVRADAFDYGELDLVEDIESTRELAVEFIEEYEMPTYSTPWTAGFRLSPKSERVGNSRSHTDECRECHAPGTPIPRLHCQAQP